LSPICIHPNPKHDANISLEQAAGTKKIKGTDGAGGKAKAKAAAKK
jgi:hypothetical protein